MKKSSPRFNRGFTNGTNVTNHSCYSLIRVILRVFQLEHYCAGRVVAERRIETKRVTVEYRSLGFDTLRYSTCVR